MKKVEFVIYTNIILDYCERCRGFWLDGRELGRINGEVRKLNAASRDASTPPMMWFAFFIWSLPHLPVDAWPVDPPPATHSFRLLHPE